MQNHLGHHVADARAAEKLFVDFAGDTVPIFDAAAAVDRRAHIFVLGASNYTCWPAPVSEDTELGVILEPEVARCQHRGERRLTGIAIEQSS